jgi:hypothetical protein
MELKVPKVSEKQKNTVKPFKTSLHQKIPKNIITKILLHKCKNEEIFKVN